MLWDRRRPEQNVVQTKPSLHVIVEGTCRHLNRGGKGRDDHDLPARQTESEELAVLWSSCERADDKSTLTQEKVIRFSSKVTRTGYCGQKNARLPCANHLIKLPNQAHLFGTFPGRSEGLMEVHVEIVFRSKRLKRQHQAHKCSPLISHQAGLSKRYFRSGEAIVKPGAADHPDFQGDFPDFLDGQVS